MGAEVPPDAGSGDDEQETDLEDAPARRTEPITAVLLGAAVLRLLAVIGQHAFVYTDSIDYETLDFSGGSRRPWVTPLLYHLTDDRAMRIVWQGGIGALCWSYLALQAAALVVDRRVRWVVLVSILLLSLTTTVTNWDTAMLSESLAISLTALLLGTLLRLWREPTHRSVVMVLAAAVLWLFTRQNHLVMSILVVVALVAVLVVHRVREGHVHRVLAVLLAGFVALTGVGVVSYGQNTEILHYNLAQVIGNRVFPDIERSSWFMDEGMPVPEDHPLGGPAAPQDLLADREFAEWIDTEAVGVYAKFLLTHPWYSFTGVFEDLASDQPPFGDRNRADEVMLATPDPYGVGRQVIPEVLEDLLFQPGSAGIIVFALLVTIALTVVQWRVSGPDPRWLVPLVALAVQWPALTAVWHASTAELGRLSLPSAIVIRIALLLQLALLADVQWQQAHEQADPEAAPA